MNRNPIEKPLFVAQGTGATLFAYALWLATNT